MEFLTNLYLPIYKKEDKKEERELFIDFDDDNVYIHYKGVDIELFKVNENKQHNDVFKFLIYYINYIVPKGEIIFFEKNENNFYERLKKNENLNKTFVFIEDYYLLRTYFNEKLKKVSNFSHINSINVINNIGIANEQYLGLIPTDVKSLKKYEVKKDRGGNMCSLWTNDLIYKRNKEYINENEVKSTIDIFAIKRI